MGTQHYHSHTHVPGATSLYGRSTVSGTEAHVLAGATGVLQTLFLRGLLPLSQTQSWGQHNL